jgi:hypothetical protein
MANRRVRDQCTERIVLDQGVRPNGTVADLGVRDCVVIAMRLLCDCYAIAM